VWSRCIKWEEFIVSLNSRRERKSLLVEVINFANNILKLVLALLSHVLVNGGWLAIHKVKAMLLVFGNFSGAFRSTEEVFVLLLGEVDVIHTVGVRVLCRVVPVVLEERVRTQVAGLTVLPWFKSEVTHGTALVEVRNNHGTLVSVVINHLGTQVPLLLFAQTSKDVVRAHFHDWDLVGEASLGGALGGTLLVFADFFVATTGDVGGTEGHVLGGLHDGGAHGAVLVTKSLVFAVGVPVIVGLVVSMVLLEGVIQVAVEPHELGHHTEVEGHLGVLVGTVVVASANGVELLVEVGVDHGIS
jgi:hypothetical protein